MYLCPQLQQRSRNSAAALPMSARGGARNASAQSRGADEAPVIGALLARMREPSKDTDLANLQMSFVFGDQNPFEKLRGQVDLATEQLSQGAGRDARAGGGGMAEQPDSSVVLLVSKRGFDERDRSRAAYLPFGEIAAYTVTHPNVHVNINDSAVTGIGLRHESTVTISQPGVKPPRYFGEGNLYENAKMELLKDNVVSVNVWTGDHETEFELHAMISTVVLRRGDGEAVAADTVLSLLDPCFAPNNMTTFCVATREVGADGVAVYKLPSLTGDSHYYVNACGTASGDAAHAQILFACAALSP